MSSDEKLGTKPCSGDSDTRTRRDTIASALECRQFELQAKQAMARHRRIGRVRSGRRFPDATHRMPGSIVQRPTSALNRCSNWVQHIARKSCPNGCGSRNVWTRHHRRDCRARGFGGLTRPIGLPPISNMLTFWLLALSCLHRGSDGFQASSTQTIASTRTTSCLSRLDFGTAGSVSAIREAKAWRARRTSANPNSPARRAAASS